MQKGFGVMSILIGLAILATLVSGAFYVGRSTTPKSTPAPVVSQTPQPSSSDETANWKTYTSIDKNYLFKYPSSWKEDTLQVLGSKSVLEINDTKGVYSFSFTQQANYNNGTEKPFKSVDEFINMPYKVKRVIVDGQEAAQPLPRAGNENVNGAFFFSKDSKFIYILELTTNDRDNESQIQEGQKIFNQILSTFKFLSKSQSWKTYSGQYVDFKYPNNWQPRRSEAVGSTLEFINLGIPGVTIDQDLGFSGVSLESIKPNDVVKEEVITIGGKSGFKWTRKGSNYVSYDYATRGYNNEGSFSIHVTLGSENKILEEQLDQVAQSVTFK